MATAQRTGVAPAIVARGLTRRFGKLVGGRRHRPRDPARADLRFPGPERSGKSTTIRMLCGLLRLRQARCACSATRCRATPSDARRARLHDAAVLAVGRPDRARESRLHVAGLRPADARSETRASTRSPPSSTLAPAAAARRHAERRPAPAARARGGDAARPELLLLDEPTSAVDPQSRRDFWESLFALVGRGTTILVSTHYMDEAERCHRLAILDRGRLVAEGVPKRADGGIPAHRGRDRGGGHRAARAASLEDGAVLSIAQLGTRLHALLDRQTPRAAARCARRARASRRRCAGRSSREPRGRVRRRDGLQAAMREPAAKRGREAMFAAACSRSCSRSCASSRATG